MSNSIGDIKWAINDANMQVIKANADITKATASSEAGKKKS